MHQICSYFATEENKNFIKCQKHMYFSHLTAMLLLYCDDIFWLDYVDIIIKKIFFRELYSIKFNATFAK